MCCSLQDEGADPLYSDIGVAVPSPQQQHLFQLPHKHQPKPQTRQAQQPAALSSDRDFSHMGDDDGMLLEEEADVTFDARQTEEQGGTPAMMRAAGKHGKAGESVCSMPHASCAVQKLKKTA